MYQFFIQIYIFFLKIKVAVQDKCDDQNTAIAQIKVIVNRNENAPVFTQSQYRRNINEDFPIGERVIEIKATDEDEGRAGDVRYEIVEDRSTENVTSFFFLNPKTGELTLIKSLLDDPSKQQLYTISVKAADQSLVQRSAETAVQILVTRNLYPPVFDKPSYSATISENDPVDTTVVNVKATDSDDPQVFQ